MIFSKGQLMEAVLAKSQPTLSDVHISQPLTSISMAWLQLASAYIAASRIFPIVPVSKQSDLYYVFNRGDFLRDEARPRAPGTESAGGGFNLSTAGYSCITEAFHWDIPDPIRANADSILSLDRAGTEFVSQILAIRRERRFFTSFFTTGVWGTDITGVNAGPAGGQTVRWNVTGSLPRADIDTAKNTLLQQGLIGLKFRLLLGQEVFTALRGHADVRDQFKYTSAESITADMLARYFDVDEVVVSQGAYVSSVEGAAVANAFFAGKHALLVAVPPSPSIMTPSAGYIFSWTGYMGGQGGIRIKRLRADLLESDRIEGDMSFDMKVTAPSLGYFFSTIVA